MAVDEHKVKGGEPSCCCCSLERKGEGESPFPAHLFPASFTLLYCPYKDCLHEMPFMDPLELIQHVSSFHGVKVERPSGVVPFLDRYLEVRIKDGLDIEISTEEDNRIRNELQKQRLTEILSIQAQERTTTHKRGRQCLFCEEFCPTIGILFAHMFSTHDFNIGQLDNLVMVDEFLEMLQGKLHSNTCIYCEGVFPTRNTLKKHLKNKNHFRIHPQNHIYDRFYIVNYLQVGTLYDEAAARSERELEEAVNCINNPETEWDELTESIDQRTMCLICSHVADEPEACLLHMTLEHDFDWIKIRQESTLNTIYDSIKIINYLRVCQAELTCIYCDALLLGEGEGEEGGRSEWIAHLETHRPYKIPDRRLWNDPRYLFPIYEDDPLLCYLEE